MNDPLMPGTPQPTSNPAPAPTDKLNLIFFGPNRLRAGWRFLIFLAIIFVVSSATGLIARAFHLGGVLFTSGANGQLTPIGLSTAEAIFLAYALIATFVMMRIEHRKFSDYGLPLNLALRKNFWKGTLWGFLAISGTLLAIFLLHGFRITALNIHGTTILTSTIAWSITFLIVGLSEEFTFRGYPQFTLTSGIGFWPSAFLLSGLFALAHMGNPGETVYGVLSVVTFGLLFCLCLRRSGDLWLAVGFHAGWDWGQTFFYGVHDSGLIPYHNLLASDFSGPKWLSGGTVGPEGSIFTPIALGIVALLFSMRHKEIRYRPMATSRSEPLDSSRGEVRPTLVQPS